MKPLARIRGYADAARVSLSLHPPSLVPRSPGIHFLALPARCAKNEVGQETPARGNESVVRLFVRLLVMLDTPLFEKKPCTNLFHFCQLLF